MNIIGDPKRIDEGFRMLVYRYKERIYWTVRRIVNRHEDADDIVQEVFIKVYKSIDGFNSESQLFTWIYRIAVNESLSYLRKASNKITRQVDTEHADLLNQNVENSLPNSEKIEKILNQAIEQLPEKQKIVFNLRYYDEMKYQDMSKILGTSEGGLKALYHHAVKKIETHIKNHDY